MPTKAVGLSRDLPNGRVMRAEVDGTDIVVWRNTKGAIAAWDNRCPHRGMRLSHGFVRGDALACLYHGWQYGASGQCSYIPAHPDLEPPVTICTKAYNIIEAHGVIWVAVSEPAVPETLDAGLEPLRSFLIHADEESVLAAIKANAPAVKITVLTNPQGANHTLVTMLLEPSPLSVKQEMSRWCEAIRNRVEQDSRKAVA